MGLKSKMKKQTKAEIKIELKERQEALKNKKRQMAKDNLESKKQRLAELQAKNLEMKANRKPMTKKNKKALSIIGGLFAFGIIVGAISGGSEESETPEVEVPTMEEPTEVAEVPTIKESTEVAEVPFEELSFEEKVSDIVSKSTLGKRPTEVYIEGEQLYIDLPLSDNLNNKLIVSSMKRQTKDMFEKLLTLADDNGITRVTIGFETGFIDKLGNESVGYAGLMVGDIAKLKSVNWENSYMVELEDMSESVWVHPSLK